MSRFYLLRLVVLAGMSLGWNSQVFAQTVSFGYTGVVQSYVVPVGVTALAVDMAGAQGGTYTGISTGGLGGRVQCLMAVTAGQTYYLFVGQQGQGYNPGTGGGNSGGGANGGSGGNDGGGAPGGGATDIRTINGATAAALSSRIVVAGAGGGAAWDCGENGGSGGGLTGGLGNNCGSYLVTSDGGPGTQTGAGAAGNSSSAGGFGPGGSAYCCYYGGGGAGGWFGSGGAYSGSACGGSSYTLATQTSPIGTCEIHTQGYRSGNGYINITPVSIWYSNPSGGDASNLGAWWSNSNGTGANPTSFAGTYTTWVFQSNMVSSAALSFGGNVSIVLGGTFTPLASSITTVGGNWSNTGGYFVNNGGTVTFTGTNAAANAIACGSATVITLGGTTGGMTGSNRFNNLTFTAASAGISFSFGANSVDIGGNFTISSANNTVIAPTSGNLMQVAGSWSNSGGTFTNSNGTVNMNGTTAVTYSNTGTNSFYNLNFNETSTTYTINSALTATNNLTIAAGAGTVAEGIQTVTVGGNFTNGSTFTTSTGTMNVSGNFVNNAGATFTSTSTSNIGVAGSWSNNGTFNCGTGTVTMNGSTSGLGLSGNLTASSGGAFYNLTISGSGTFTFDNNVDVNEEFSQSNGNVVAPALMNVGLSQSGNYAFFHSGGTFNPNGGTLNYNSTTASASEYIYANGMTTTTGGTGTINCLNNLTYNGGSSSTLYFESACTLKGSLSNFVTNATLSTLGSTLNVGGNWLNNGFFANGSGTVNMTGTGTNTLSGNMTAATSAAFYILNFTGSGGTYVFSSNADIANGINISAGASVTAPSNLNVGGGWTDNGSFNNNGGTVTFNGTSATISGSSLTGSNKFNNLTFSGCNTYSFSSNTDIGGNFLNSCGVVNMNGNTYNIGGNFTNNSVFNQGTSTINMNGSSGSYTLSASGGSLTFYNLNFTGGANWSFPATGTVTVNNNFVISSGTVTAPSTNLSIAGSYTNNGDFSNNNSTVTMTGSGTMNGNMTSSSSRFYNLTMANTGGNYTFNAGAEVYNTYTQSGSQSVTAPASTLTVWGNFAKTGGGNFIPTSTGTVILQGGGPTTNPSLNLSGGMNNANTTSGSCFNNLTVNGTTGVNTWSNNASPMYVFNDLVINGGTLQAPTGNNILSIGGNYTNNGTFTHNNGTVSMTGVSGASYLTLNGNMTTASNSPFYYLYFQNAGNYTFTANADVNYQFLQTNGTVVAPAGNLNCGLSMNGNYAFEHTAGTFNPNGGTVTINNSGANTLYIYANGMSSTTGTLNCFNNLVLNGATTSTYYLTTPIYTIGNFTNLYSNNVYPESTVFVGGNWTNNGFYYATTFGTALYMDGTTSGLTMSGNMANLYQLYIGNGATTGAEVTMVPSTGTATISNILTIYSNNTLVAPTGTLNIGSTYTNNGTFVAPTGSTVAFNAGSASLNGNMTVANNSSPFYNLSFSGGNTYTFNNKVTALNNFYVSSGTVQQNGQTLIVGNAFDETGGTFTSGADTTYIGGNFINNGTFNNGNGVVNMNGSSGSYTIGGTSSMTANPFYNMVFSGGANWTFTGAAQVNANFYIGSGTVNAPSSTTLQIGNLTGAASYYNFGTFNSNSGTVIMDGSAASTMNGNMTGSSNRFYNLTMAGSGNYTFGSNPAEVYNTYSQTSSGSVTAPTSTLTVWGQFSKTGGGNFIPTASGTVVMQGGGPSAPSLNLTGNMNSTPNTSGSCFNNLTINGTLGSNVTCSSNPFYVYGNMLIASGTFVAPSGQQLSVGQNWTNNGAFSHNNGIINMTGISSPVTLNGNMTQANNGAFYYLYFQTNNSTFSFTNNADVNYQFYQATGTVVAPAILNCGLNQSGTYAFEHTGGTFNPNGGTVNINNNGAATVYVYANGMTTTTGTLNCFNNLTFNGGTTSTYYMATPIYTTGNLTNLNANNLYPESTVYVGGNWTNNGNYFATTYATALYMDGNSSQTMSGNMANLYQLYIGNGSTTGAEVTMVPSTGTATLSNLLTIYANNTLVAPTGTLNIGSTYTNNGTFVAPTGSSVVFNSGTATLNGNMTVANNSSPFYNLSFTGGNTYTFNNKVTALNNFYITSGTVQQNGYTLIVGNAFDETGGTFTSGVDTTYIGGNFINNSVFNNGNGVVNMNGSTGSFTVGGTSSMQTYPFYSLMFTGGADWTFNGSATCNSSFYINSGTVTAPSGGTIIIGNTTTGNYANWGTFNNNNGTIQMNSSAASTMVGNMTGTNRFYNLTMNNSGTYTFGTYPAEVYNTYSQTGGGSVTAPSNTLTVWGSFSKTGGGNFIPTATGTVIFNGTGPVSANVITTTGGMNTTTNTSGSCFNNLTFAGTTGISTWTCSGNPFYVYGDLNITGGSFTAPASQTLSVGRSWTNNGIFVANNSTVSMTGIAGPNDLSGNMTVANNGAFFNLSFTTNSQTFTFVNNADVLGTYSQTTATIIAPPVLQVGGAFSMTGGTFNPNIANNGTVVFNATTAGLRTVTASSMSSTAPFTTTSSCFNNITFNSGSVTGTSWNYANSNTIAGNVSILTGTVTPTSGITMTVYGNWTNNGVFVGGNGTNTSTVTFAGTTSGLTLNGNMTRALGSNFYNLIFNGTNGQWTFNNAADVLGNFQITTVTGIVNAPASTLQLYGNFQLTNGTFYHNNGTVAMVGTVLQTFQGPVSATFNNLIINNPIGCVIGNQVNTPEYVNGTLTLQAGKLYLGFNTGTGANNSLIMGPTANPISYGTTGSFSTANMIVERSYTTGTSLARVLKQFIANGSYTFPVGDTATNSYSPITVNVTGGTFGPGSYVGVGVFPQKDPNNNNLNNYIKRYWKVTMDSIASPTYSITGATYVPGDVVGTESAISMGQFPGSYPWVKFGPTNATTHTLISGNVNSVYSEFTGISTAAPAVTASANTAICYGSSTPLSLSAPTTGDSSVALPFTYTWAPASSLSASFGLGVIASPTVTTVYTVTVTDANGFTGTSTVTVTVNPVPTPITGNPTLCSGISETLGGSISGGVWTSSNPFWATVNSSTGVVTGQAAGNPVITYTIPATGCYGVLAMTINNSPAGISGVTHACAGGSTTLSDGTPGGAWSSSNTTWATVDPVMGTVAALAAGVPTISYVLPVTGCYALAPYTVYALPTAYTVTGGGSYCAGGTGVNVGLSGSQTGVNYQLSVGGVAIGTDPGTNAALSFGVQGAPGNYTVFATNPTTTCTNNMTGSVNVVQDSLPRLDTISGGGSYCAGSGGVNVYLNNSVGGIEYNLMNDGTVVGDSLGGPGRLNFGSITAPGTYTVMARKTATGCTQTMFGSEMVVENTLPEAENVTGGGSYCATGAGVRIGLDYGSTGVNYSLYLEGNTIPVNTVSGASGTLDFGPVYAAGTYSVSGTNAVTGCTNAMTGTKMVVVDSLPLAHTVSTIGPASYCSGGSGVQVTIAPTDLGISYQLQANGVNTGTSMEGNMGLLNFGYQTTGGVYTVIATNTVTACMASVGTTTVTVNPLPMADTVMGTGSYCAGSSGLDVSLSTSQNTFTYKLYNNGVFVSGSDRTSTGGVVDFGDQTAAGVYKVIGTNPSTGCPGPMYDSAVITINPLPAVYALTGGGAYCFGGNGQHIGISYSDAGVNYHLELGGSQVGATLAGDNSGLDFGAQTVAGTYSVVAVNAVTGCSKVMGTVNISVNALPALYEIGATSSSYCQGGTGIGITLSGSDTHISYQLYDGSMAVGSPLPGSTGHYLNFGSYTNSGVYYVVAKNTITSCYDTMMGTAPVSINPLPTAYGVSGGGGYCSGGTGVMVGLSMSDTGISYMLMPSGVSMTGTGGALNFGNQTIGGEYKVIATNVATTCVNTMADSALVTVNALPTAETVIGGGGYCAGSAGALVSLSGSDLQVNYQVYASGGSVGGLISGTGSAISLGDQTVAGLYTVVGTNVATGCSNSMANTVSVSINALPRPYTVLGGGSYCPGSLGVIDSLSGSDLGVDYSLYLGTTLVRTIAGTGGVMNYGYQTATGIYTVVAKDESTGCTNNMIYSDTVSIYSLPTSYELTGGGNYCAGTPGVHVGLTVGVIGINYQLYNDTTMVGSPVPGGGLPLDFGLQTATGTYNVMATSTITGCSANMSDSVMVGITPDITPSVSIFDAMGDSVCAGSAVTFTAMPVNGGTPAYQWFVNGAYSGSGNTFTYVPSNADNLKVVMNSTAACAMPAVATQTIVLNVVNHVTPSVSITANPGSVVCAGTPVTYNASTQYAGTDPQYIWVVNGTFNNTGMSSYTFTPDNRDYVMLMMLSNYPCRLMDTIFSNGIVMNVDTISPTVAIVSHPGQIVKKGQYDTLVAVVTNAGPAPHFAWTVNSSPLVGDTMPTLISNQFSNNDSVTCVVTAGGNVCGGVAFNSLKITVMGNVGVGTVTSGNGEIRVSPNPNKGTFSIIGNTGTITDETISVEMMDMVGQVVYTGKIDAKKGAINSRIEVEGLANGMYMVNLRSGSETTILHVVIEQ